MPFSAEIEPPREATRENTAARGRKITGQIGVIEEVGCTARCNWPAPG